MPSYVDVEQIVHKGADQVAGHKNKSERQKLLYKGAVLFPAEAYFAFTYGLVCRYPEKEEGGERKGNHCRHNSVHTVEIVEWYSDSQPRNTSHDGGSRKHPDAVKPLKHRHHPVAGHGEEHHERQQHEPPGVACVAEGHAAKRPRQKKTRHGADKGRDGDHAACKSHRYMKPAVVLFAGRYFFYYGEIEPERRCPHHGQAGRIEQGIHSHAGRSQKQRHEFAAHQIQKNLEYLHPAEHRRPFQDAPVAVLVFPFAAALFFGSASGIGLVCCAAHIAA